MSRTQNVKRNLTFNVIRFMSQLILQFVLRTILIYVMGAEYIGLNGLFSNIFGVLNLAELGIGSAIVFAMYKPIADGDLDKVRALQNLYKKFYLVIALIVLGIGGILTPFINIFIKEEVTVNVNIYILFVMYLLNTVVGYFSAHKRSLLLAYQRDDIEKKICTICIFGMTITQIAILLIFKNYYAFFAINIFFTILECVIVHLIANKKYPEANGKGQPLDKETKTLITKNVAALSLHKVGSAVVFSTDNILISSFWGVAILGAYSNYALIISSFTTFFSLLSTALAGSVGNLIASCDKEYTYTKFKQIYFILSFLISFCFICLVILLQSFIKLWTGGGVYLLDYSTICLLCVSFYLSKMRVGVSVFKDCAGIFWQNRWQPIVESVVNLGASIGLAYLMGINGIILGTIISTIIAPLWVEPLVLFKHYFKKSIWLYFKQYLLNILITLVVGGLAFVSCYFIPDGGIGLLVAKFAVCIAVTGVGLLISYCWTSEFKQTYKMFKQMLGNFLHRKSKAKELVTIDDSNSSLENKEQN